MQCRRIGRTPAARSQRVVVAVVAVAIWIGALVGCDDSTSPSRSAAIVGAVVDSAGRSVSGARIGVSYVIPGYSIGEDWTTATGAGEPLAPRWPVAVGALAVPACTLGVNFPNPFSSGTNFPLELDEESGVRLTILGAGRDTIATVADTTLTAGRYLLAWRIDTADLVPYGAYTAHLAVTHGDSTCKTERSIFRQPLLPLPDDFAAGGLTTTSALGRFALAMEDLAVGGTVTLTDVTGAFLGTSTVADSVVVCAHDGEGDEVRFACEGVSLGNGNLDVTVEIVLPE